MFIFLATLLFVMTESIDLCAGGFSFGLGRVRLSFAKVVIVNFVGKVLLACALFAGYFLGEFVPRDVGIAVCFLILTALGSAKIINYIIHKNDIIRQTSLSTVSAIVLGVVLSLDGCAMAIGMAIGSMPFMFIPILLATKLVTDQVLFLVSNRIGLRIGNTKGSCARYGDLMAGCVIISVAVIKLLFEVI